MWTVEDWRVIPDDLLRHEIIGGVHYTQHAPTLRHQMVSGNLLFAVHQGAERFGQIIPYVGVELSPHDAVVPDLVFIGKDQHSVITDRYVEGAPAIVVEIVLNETRDMDERIKRQLYERVGVLEYWLVDCERDRVKIFRRAQGDGFEPIEVHDAITSPLLPEFALDVKDVFAE